MSLRVDEAHVSCEIVDSWAELSQIAKHRPPQADAVEVCP